MPPVRRLLICAVGAALAGLVVLAVLPAVFGAPRPIVYVAWTGASHAEREALEARFSLAEPHAIGPDAFSYVPGDTAPPTLAALVAHSAVLATEGIDRRTGTISRTAPLTARRGGVLTSAWLARATKAGGAMLLALGAGLAIAVVCLRGLGAVPAHDRWRSFTRHPGESTRAAAQAAVAWLQRGIPLVTPDAAGIFRIVFISCVLAVAAHEPAGHLRIVPAEVAASGGPYGAVVRWLAANPDALRLVDRALWICGALVVVGALTREAFAAFVAAFLLWSCAFTAGTTLHAVSALQVTLLCLLAAPWGDAWSVDAWVRRRWFTERPGLARNVPSRRYGFALWVPGFVLGVAYLAAAWAKVGHGPAWVLNGTVRQHFLTDLDHAWTSWGPALTAQPVAAVVLSAAAVAVEAAVISAAFVPSVLYRLAIGVAALSLLAGFALFQGIVWPGWWVLLLGFVPWPWLLPRAGSAPAGAGTSRIGLTRFQATAVVGVLILQLGASIVMRDFRPFISGYDMYATTHGNEIDNARGLERVHVMTAAHDGWREVPSCTFELPATEGPGDDASGRRGAFAAHLTRCLQASTVHGPVRLDLDRQTYDWSSHVLRWRPRVDVAGPFSPQAPPAAWPFGVVRSP